MNDYKSLKSSASVWVRDIPLTTEQKSAMEVRVVPNYEARTKGARTNMRKGRELREQYQQEGREKAKETRLAACCWMYALLG